MTVVIRQATPLDGDDLVRLWLGLSADGQLADERYRIRADADTTAEHFVTQQWLADPDHRVVIAGDSEVVGFMTARLAPPHHVLVSPVTAVITDAFVAPAHRRRGVGRHLFEAIGEWAGTRGVAQLEVGTLALDQRAVAFWRSLGFGDWRVTLARPT